MSVLGRILVSSAQRLDLPDFKGIDSFVAGDFKYLLSGLFADNRPYILKGFDIIDPQLSIGGTSVSVRVADSAVIYPSSSAGPFFHGLQEGNVLAQPLIPELKKNATNYVYLTLTTYATSNDTRSFWDEDKDGGAGGEFTQDINTESILIAQLGVSVSSFPTGTTPIAKIVVGANFIVSIEDSRDMLFRLGTGGTGADPYNNYDFKSLPDTAYARNEPSSSITSQLNPNPFQGGDKNISSLKEWMDVVMTKLKEIGGTTYWYQDSSSYNLLNIFLDSLGSSIKSKGRWSHSDVTAGQLSWTEDIIYQSIVDKRDLIIRSATKTMNDEEVMYVKFTRNKPTNPNGFNSQWINGVNYVNASSIGTFQNLSKGDWVKKTDDTQDKYLRVERFWDSLNGGGSSTSASLAMSIELSEVYTGVSEIKQAVYTKGVYSDSNGDILVAPRSTIDLVSAGSDLFWLAIRTDTVQNISTVTNFALNIDMVDADGAAVKVVSHDGTGSIGSRTLVAHGLTDGEHITVTSSTDYNGTYQVEVIDTTTFYVYSSTIAADQVGTGRYALVVAAATRSHTNPSEGIQLESANHGFTTGQSILIDGTGSATLNGSHSVFVRTSTSFTYPVSGAAGNVVGLGTASLAKVNVRTEIGEARIIQGETKFIGQVDTDNIQQYIGMTSLNQTNPVYTIDSVYNTINGRTNYNAEESDSLTSRAAKLTAMIADKAQDKTIKFAPSFDWVVNTTSGANQNITFSNLGAGAVESYTLTFPAKVNLAAGEYFWINDAGNANTYYMWMDFIGDGTTQDPLPGSGISVPVNVSSATTNVQVATAAHSSINALPNITSTNNLDGTLTVVNDISGSTTDPYNHNMGSGFSISMISQGIDVTENDTLTILMASSKNNGVIYLTGTLVLPENSVAYFTVNRNAIFSLASLGSLIVTGIDSVPLDENIFIFAYRLTDTFVWLWDQTELSVGQNLSMKSINSILNDNCYDEYINVIAGAPSSDNEIQGPVLAGSSITLPLDSRDSNSPQGYIVGKANLEIFLNGVELTETVDWIEVGTTGVVSSSIILNIDLQVNDLLKLRIDTFGGYASGGSGGGGGSGEANTASNVGVGANVFYTKVLADLRFRRINSGAGINVTQNAFDITISATPASLPNLTVVTLTGTNHIAAITEDVFLVNNSGADRLIILPTAAGNSGKRFDIKKIDAGNILFIRTSNDETIDGVNCDGSSLGLDFQIPTQWMSRTIVSNGISWYIL